MHGSMLILDTRAPSSHWQQQYQKSASMRPVLQESAEDDDADDGEGLMAAYGCMRALSTVLDSVSGMAALFPELEAILFPLMQRLASNEGTDVFEEVLELISYFTYFSPTVRAALLPCMHRF